MKIRIPSVVFLLAALLFVLLLAGCGPNRSGGNGGESSPPPATGSNNSGVSAPATEPEPSKPAELTVWAHYPNVTSEVVKGFEETTGIKVNVVEKNMFEQKEKLTLDGPAGLGPDIIYQPHDGLGQIALEGLVQPIELDDGFQAQFLPKAIEAWQYDGQLWGVPLAIDTFALFYNKKLSPEPPATVADLEKLGDTLTDKDQDEYGFLIDPANFYFSYSYMAGYGGYIFGKDADGNYNVNDIGLNNEGALKGANLVQHWVKQGYVPATMNSDIMNGLFTQGKVGAVVSGPWSVPSYHEALGDDLGVTPMPMLDNGVIPPTFTGVKGWMLSAFSDNQYWATELMKYMSGYEASLYNYEQTGDIPPRPDIMDTDLITGNPIVSGFAEQMIHGELTPNVPAMVQVWIGTADAMIFTVQGEDPQPLWDDAVQKVKDAIALQESQK